MKKFILFAGGSDYYTGGGMEDFRGSYATIDEAENAYEAMEYVDWHHIVERDTWTAVKADGKDDLIRLNSKIWQTNG